MNFAIYSQTFREHARKKGLADTDVHLCLVYAESLYRRGLPIIYDVRHLAQLIGWERMLLYRVSNAQGKFYREFRIPKRSGGERTICEPLPALKSIQHWILDQILYRLPIHPTAKGFVPMLSLADSARFHQNQDVVINLDLRDYFPSIRFPRILAQFRRAGYSSEVAFMLAKLCTLNNCLPQGAPTSPALANLVSSQLDRRLFAWARSWGGRYTRYADDLSFSGRLNPERVIAGVTDIVRDEGFEVAVEKTHVMTQGTRQSVLGLVVNCAVSVPRDFIRSLRQEIHYCKKFGVSAHCRFRDLDEREYIESLLGRVSFVMQYGGKQDFCDWHKLVLSWRQAANQ